MAWKLEFHSQRLERELAAMPPGLLARLLRYTERLEVFGPDLGMPHTRAIETPAGELAVAIRRMKEVRHE
ncbi:MAG TPA: type II toxin-antitoxin system RelE/ParE family toxin [Zeimonas sp.]|nr:type II toxin-antitoxin system RelE/ParE family toxin [Zeimonas sp.]